MTTDAQLRAFVEALGLPPDARVDARVPKKLLVEQAASTSADKRAIQEGIDELHWFAACKPVTIGVPSFADDTWEYLEIAVIGCTFRLGAKAARLIELIHRAIPYPVLLIAAEQDGITMSAAHKRRAQNGAGRTVIERVAAVSGLHPSAANAAEVAFLNSLSLTLQPRADLYVLYCGWLARIEAMIASRVTGVFASTDDAETVDRRRAALDAHARLTREIETLRGRAKREKQLNRRVDLNMAIQRLEADIQAYKDKL